MILISIYSTKIKYFLIFILLSPTIHFQHKLMAYITCAYVVYYYLIKMYNKKKEFEHENLNSKILVLVGGVRVPYRCGRVCVYSSSIFLVTF